MRKGRKGNFDKVFKLNTARGGKRKKNSLRDVVQPRSQGLFPGFGAARPQAREKALGTRLDVVLVSSSAKFENLGVISSVLSAV